MTNPLEALNSVAGSQVTDYSEGGRISLWRQALFASRLRIIFCNSDLDKSTTVCKVEDPEAFSKPFLEGVRP